MLECRDHRGGREDPHGVGLHQASCEPWRLANAFGRGLGSNGVKRCQTRSFCSFWIFWDLLCFFSGNPSQVEPPGTRTSPATAAVASPPLLRNNEKVQTLVKVERLAS